MMKGFWACQKTKGKRRTILFSHPVPSVSMASRLYGISGGSKSILLLGFLPLRTPIGTAPIQRVTAPYKTAAAHSLHSQRHIALTNWQHATW